MKIKHTKKEIKRVKARVANIALGYVPGAVYQDLYSAISDAEATLLNLTFSKSTRVVLMAHKALEDMQEIRQLAHKRAF